MVSTVDHASQLGSIPVDQPVVMGVLNTTPDSFSDGGTWGTVDRAVAHAEAMVSEGAHVIDVGGESTRPGAHPVKTAAELERVLPVIERLAGRCVMSIDTTKPDVAEAAIEAGVSIVNDVSASLEQVAGAYGVGWIAMHRQGESRTMQENPTYGDVVGEVAGSLRSFVERAQNAGVRSVWVDPGIGFGKTIDHNLTLLRDLEAFTQVAPVVIGVSRKRFIGEIHATADTMSGFVELPEPIDRVEGSVAAAVWAWRRGANIVRTHDVKTTVLAARLIQRPKWM